MREVVHYSALTFGAGESRLIGEIFWILVAAGALIWIMFVALKFYALHGNPAGESARKRARIYLIGGGVIFPVIMVTISIILTLRPLPQLLARAPSGSLTIHVSGLQWWWRVRYEVGGKMVETANEIYLPVNRPANFELSSEDVIHSFWIPSLAGKMDMIPGRKTHLSFTPRKTGTYVGNCAEYCGASHALMRLEVKVVEEKEFEDWLRNLSSGAVPGNHPGERAFAISGCTSCHAVRGVFPGGELGPDLTNFGSRRILGAGAMRNDLEKLHRWIKDPKSHKPGVKMPGFKNLPEEELMSIAEWLGGLR